MRRIALIVCCLAAVMPVGTARAAATIEVDVRSNFFSPAVARPAAGDTVRWTVRQGNHDVVTYAGTMSFASPLMNSSSPPYSQTYAGGEVLYRCTPHSRVSDDGVCTGMCAVLTDRTAPPVAPVVAQPAAGSTVPDGSVVFGGTAEPWTIVRLIEGSTIGEVLAGGDGSWSLARPLAGGQHTVTVRADAADGTAGGSTTVSFTVGGVADSVPPSVTITSGPFTGGAGSAGIFGEASDNVAVARVRVRARSALGAVLADVVADCSACGSNEVAWSASVDLPPGVATLTVTADDAAGNPSAPAGPVYAVIVPG